MLGSFIRNYLELPQKKKKIVCLGGGVGTSQILKGLRPFDLDLTAIVSMADDGGSAGRLRRAFSVPPPGDLVNCLAALSDEESVIKDLFLYRFKGNRYSKDTELGGQKLGNLIFVALTDIYGGDTNRAFEEFSKIISSNGRVLPATDGDVNIWARTEKGKKVYGEQNIDLGKYNGTRSLKEVHLDPENPRAYKGTTQAIENADMIIAGPGDLFSTVLPVLIIPSIKKALQKSKVKKIFIMNIANKPFETSNFKTSNYMNILKNHLGKNIFDYIVVNTNQAPEIPRSLKYKYVKFDENELEPFNARVIEGDFVNLKYPLYHDSDKIAKAVIDIIK